MLETINLPEIETVNGSIIMEANMEAPPTGSLFPNEMTCFRLSVEWTN